MSDTMTNQEVSEFYEKNAKSLKRLEDSKIGMAYTVSSVQKLLSGSRPARCDWTFKGIYIVAEPVEQRPEQCYFEVYHNEKLVTRLVADRCLICNCGETTINLCEPELFKGIDKSDIHTIVLVRQSLYEIAFKVEKGHYPPDWYLKARK